ncbi:hypothetical protein, partial [Curtobacterium sp. S6]
SGHVETNKNFSTKIIWYNTSYKQSTLLSSQTTSPSRTHIASAMITPAVLLEQPYRLFPGVST